MWEAPEDDLFADGNAPQRPVRREAGPRSVTGELTADDLEVDRTLRPKTLDDYCGQERVRENLRVLIQAARDRNEPLDHVIFSGPPGLGKTTLAGVVANEMGAKLHTTSGPAIARTGDLAALLTNLGNSGMTNKTFNYSHPTKIGSGIASIFVLCQESSDLPDRVICGIDNLGCRLVLSKTHDLLAESINSSAQCRRRSSTKIVTDIAL